MAFNAQLTSKHIQQLDSKVDSIIKPLHNERLGRILKELVAEVRYYADLEDENVLTSIEDMERQLNEAMDEQADKVAELEESITRLAKRVDQLEMQLNGDETK